MRAEGLLLCTTSGLGSRTRQAMCCPCPATWLQLQPPSSYANTTPPSLLPICAVAFVGVRSIIAPPITAWFVYKLWFRCDGCACWLGPGRCATASDQTQQNVCPFEFLHAGSTYAPPFNAKRLLLPCRSNLLPVVWRAAMGSCIVLGMAASQVGPQRLR